MICFDWIFAEALGDFFKFLTTLRVLKGPRCPVYDIWKGIHETISSRDNFLSETSVTAEKMKVFQ